MTLTTGRSRVAYSRAAGALDKLQRILEGWNVDDPIKQEVARLERVATIVSRAAQECADVLGGKE